MRAPTEYRNTMFSLIEDWQKSGVSQRVFCEQHQIVPHVFYYWYKCYRVQNDVAVIEPAKRFIELHAHHTQGEAAIEVLLSCGHRIYFNQPVAASLFQSDITNMQIN